MPLAAFLQTSQERMERGENIGQYALMLRKEDIFNYGARPVIYGLSNSSPRLLSSNINSEERIINTDLLPLHEQYRYVTYDPNKVDWTHEREWRWPFNGNLNKYYSDIEKWGGIEDIKDSPGLELNKINFSEAGILVKNTVDVLVLLFMISLS